MAQKQTVVIINSGENVLLKPNISPSEAQDLAETHFGFQIREGTQPLELDSYEDRNFLLEGQVESDISKNTKAAKFVLKVCNSCSTRDLEMFELVDRMISLLASQCNGIRFPGARLTLDGKSWALAEIALKRGYDVQGGSLEDVDIKSSLKDILSCVLPSDQVHKTAYRDEDADGDRRDDHAASQTFFFRHVVRLVEFIPGFTVAPELCSKNLLIHIGSMVANIRLALKDLEPVGKMDNQELIWNLQNIHRLKTPYIEAVEGERYKSFLQSIVSDFEKETLPLLNTLDKSVIHADVSPQNVIVERDSDAQNCKLVGLIDFGCAVYSCCIFDLAIALAYFGALVPSNFVDTTSAVISGYCSILELADVEFKVLFNLVLSRVAQSLAIGEYMYRVVEPGNEYLIVNVANMKETLDVVNELGKDYILSKWKECTGVKRT